MKKRRFQISLILFTMLFLFGCMYFLSSTGEKEDLSVNSTMPTASEVSPSANQNIDIFVNHSISETERQYCLNAFINSTTSDAKVEHGGKIKGRVYYPSDFTPKDLLACAFSINEKVRYCNSPNNIEGKKYYELSVPEGTYYVYLLSPDNLIGVDGLLGGRDYIVFSNSEGVKIGESPLLAEVVEDAEIYIHIGNHIINSDLLYCPALE